MADKTDKAADIPLLQKELSGVVGKNAARLTAAVDDIDRIIETLTAARSQIAQSPDPHTASLTLAKLQNPVKEGFNAVTEDLRVVDKVRKDIGKTLSKAFPRQALPSDHDPMAAHPDLINRAIAMHLLREGQFSVASTFIQEAHQTHEEAEQVLQASPSFSNPNNSRNNDDTDMDEDTDADADDESRRVLRELNAKMFSLHSQTLQSKFTVMYEILHELKQQNLLPAIEWATSNSVELEARGSNLEFNLCKRQFVWLFKGPEFNSLPDDANNGLTGALAYGRVNFPRFSSRHSWEISQLAAAMVFAPNIDDSPYRSLFALGRNAFDDLANSFTREFCSLLGLSAESPLYVAVTAGAIALPQLMKYMNKVDRARTEWTTTQELAFETPLPASMFYHSIFVCPVSKEQTTDANPPFMLPCGHVLAKETMHNLIKHGNRVKCPYCPKESSVKDAKQIYL